MGQTPTTPARKASGRIGPAVAIEDAGFTLSRAGLTRRARSETRGSPRRRAEWCNVSPIDSTTPEPIALHGVPLRPDISTDLEKSSEHIPEPTADKPENGGYVGPHSQARAAQPSARIALTNLELMAFAGIA